MKDVVKVSWIFDVISPFAYLAFPQLSRLPAHVDVEFVPVLLAGLLRHFGQLGPAEIPSKRRFTYRFALWRARPPRFPSPLPPAPPLHPPAPVRPTIPPRRGLPAPRPPPCAPLPPGRGASATPAVSAPTR